MKKNHLSVITLLLIAIALVSLVNLCIRHRRNMAADYEYNPYVEDYFAVVGTRFGTSFEDLILQHGEPNNIILGEPFYRVATVNYDKIAFIVGYRDSTFGIVQAVIVYDPTIQFGIYKIGVGSTRYEIRHVYSFIENTSRFIDGRPCPHRNRFIENPDGDIIVRDGITGLTFEFDEKDNVKRITLVEFYIW